MLVMIGCKLVFAEKDRVRDSGMKIIRGKNKRILCIVQRQYLKKVIVRFGMQDEKPVCIPLASCFKFSGMMIPSIEEVVEYMSQKPYARVVKNLMDAMVCTQPDIAQVLSLKGMFRVNP